VGAAFYHPPTLSFGAAYAGSFFFADYVYGWIYRLDPTTGRPGAFAHVAGFVTGLVVMPDGSLLVLNDRKLDRISR
jgi:glucose/arabinose dehydrogenase